MGLVSLKLLRLPIFFVTVPCYVKRIVVEDFSVLMSVHSAPSYHASSSYIKTYSQFRRFSQSISSFSRLQIQLSHVLCCTMKSAFLTLHIQQAINVVDSGTTPLPSPPLSLYPISHHCLISSSCHLLPTWSPQFNLPM